MDVQDQITRATSSGHEGHGVHLCHRCGWPFPNLHPSAKHRRSHKKHCGTIEGYTTLIGSEVVSDDPDTDKEKTLSPKTEMKMSIGGSGGGGDGIRGSVSRSEDEFFSDAVTEFSDNGSSQGGSAKKSLDKDLFYSFNDGENGGNNEVLNAPIEIIKDANLEVSEKLDTQVEKIGETEIITVYDSSESKLDMTEMDGKCSDGLVKDRVVDPTPEPVYVSQSQEAESIEVVKVGEENVEERKTSEFITEEAKDFEVTKTTPELSATVFQYDDNVKQEICEKTESEAVKESEIKHEKIELDHETAPEVVKESEIEPRVEEVVEVSKDEKIAFDHEHVPEVTKEPEFNPEKEDLGEQIQEVVKEPDTILSEKENLVAPELEKCSKEQTEEVSKETDTVLTQKENPDATEFVKFLNGQIQDVVKEPETVLSEKDDLGETHMEKQSNEPIQEAVQELDTVLTEKENLDEDPDSIWTEKSDLDASILEKTSKENTPEVAVMEVDSVLTEKEDLGGPQLEKCSKENAQEAIEQKVENDCDAGGVVPDVSVEKITPNASGVVPEQMSVDSSSCNSLDGNCGSVSVLSTASVDAKTLHSTDKSTINPTKPVAAHSLLEPEVKDQKSSSVAEVQDSKQEPKSEALTKVNSEAEVKKSTPLVNLLGEAKSPSAKKPEHVAQKDEAVNDKEGDVASPPKLIEDGKKGRKKVKGVRSWVPFGCCSSVNVVN